MTSNLLNRPSSSNGTVVLTRDEQLVERYKRLASSPSSRRVEQALRTARYELDLPLDQRRGKIAERLRSWLALSADEGHAVVTATQDAYRQLDIEERLELLDTEHDALVKAFKFDEAQRIATLVPWLGDCEMNRPPGTANGSPALSFMAAAMALEPA